MELQRRWVVKPTANEDLPRGGHVLNEADATEFCEQEGDGDWRSRHQ